MVMSQINMMSIRLLVLVLALTTINAQNECSDGSVNCINIRNCPQIISILTDSKPLSAQMSQTLRNAQCGFEGNDPKYCCNQITTTTTTTTTIVEPEIESLDPPDVTNHPNLRLLNHQACGPVPQQRQMIGSNKTEIFQYPWMALIEKNQAGRPYTEISSCSGTIIASRYILTAASCVVEYRAYQISVTGVRVGEHDISKERDCIENNEGIEVVCAERYQFFGIDKIYPHPQYNIFTRQNNIALIKLNGSMNFTSRNVKPICLPFGTAATITHKRVIVTGWSLSNSKELLQMKIPLVTNEQCTEKYKDNIMKFFYKQLCTGTQEFGVACASFSGGALQTAGIYNGESVRIILHAVVNFGLCNHLGNPGVQTSVSYYMKWILDTMTD